MLIVSFIVTPFALASGIGDKTSNLQFVAHSDGTFSVKSEETPLGILLLKIGDSANVDVYIDEKLKKQPVSIELKKVTLIQLLQRIVKENYGIVFDKRNVTALHVLPSGKKQPVTDFSGKISIDGSRAKMFFMSSDKSKSGINNYIKKRHEVLERLAREYPDRELHAQVSFNDYMSAEQVVALVKKNKLDTVSFSIGWKEMSGGHDLKQGESIEEAMKSSVLGHEGFITALQEDINMQIAHFREQGMTDGQIQSEQAFQREATELRELIAVHQKYGVPYYGIRIVGSAKQLHALTGNDEDKLRLVDPLWGGTVEDEINNLYLMQKIAIPIKPDNNNFILQDMEDKK